MTAPPHVDSVQSSTPTAWRAARGRSARGFGQKPTEFEMCTDGARGSARRPRGPAPRPPQPTPTPPGRAAPAKPRARKAHALAHAAVTQKIWLRPHVGPSWRGRVATLPPRSEPHTRSTLPKRSHPCAPHTPATQNRNRTGPHRCNGTSPASPRTTTTSTSSSATARRRSSATTRSRAASRSSATAWTASTSSRTCHVSVFSARFRTSSCGDGVDATSRLHETIFMITRASTQDGLAPRRS